MQIRLGGRVGDATDARAARSYLVPVPNPRASNEVPLGTQAVTDPYAAPQLVELAPGRVDGAVKPAAGRGRPRGVAS